MVSRFTPLSVLGSGLLLLLLGGILFGATFGLNSDDPISTAFLVLAAVFGFFGSPAVTVGLIAVAVQLGVEAADRR